MKFEDKKCIIFDVDGVITDSGEGKMLIIKDILSRFELLQKPGVEEIVDMQFNRVVLLEKLSKIYDFDSSAVLATINSELLDFEKNVPVIENVVEFIKKNHSEYNFFTCTSLPKLKLQELFKRLDLNQYFVELFSCEDGTKTEITEYILSTYGFSQAKTLFIDDLAYNVDNVRKAGVHTLLFEQDGIDLEEKIQHIFK